MAGLRAPKLPEHLSGEVSTARPEKDRWLSPFRESIGVCAAQIPVFGTRSRHLEKRGLFCPLLGNCRCNFGFVSWHLASRPTSPDFRHGASGRWTVQGGELSMPEGDGPLEPVSTALKRNSSGYPIIVADGVEYSQCRQGLGMGAPWILPVGEGNCLAIRFRPRPPRQPSLRSPPRPQSSRPPWPRRLPP